MTTLPPETTARPAEIRRRIALSERAAAFVLSALVGVSFALHWLVGSSRRTPTLMPDEYIYTELGRSLIRTGTATVRGTPADFPALLEPILIAPFWLGDNIERSYQLTQGFQALFMSLAAVPVYLIARWIGAGRWLAIGLAAVTLAGPDHLYSSFMLGEPIAFPLALTAFYLGLRALDKTTRGRQLAFLAAAGATSFARIQYVVLFAAFFAAALLCERFRLREFLHRYALSLLLVGIPSATFFALKGSGGLGYYSGVFDLDVHPIELLYWTGTDAMLLAFASFLALVPGAIAGLAAAIARPESPRQRTFGLFLVSLALLLMVEAVLFAANGSDRFQQRYLFALIPLVAISFTFFTQRTSALRIPVIALTAVLLIISFRVPLSSHTVVDKAQDSQFLAGITYLVVRFGEGDGSLIAALVAALLLLIAALAIFRPKAGVPLALLAVVVAGSMTTLAAAENNESRSNRTDFSYFPADRSAIDHSVETGGVGLLNTPESSRHMASELMFWNRSLNDVLELQLGGVARIDALGQRPARIADDGSLLVEGKRYRSPLVIMHWGTQMQVTGARKLTGHINWTLWRPDRDFRISSYTDGAYFDGWLRAIGRTIVWPDESGRVDAIVRYRLELPDTAARNLVMEFKEKGFKRGLRLRPGVSAQIDIPVKGRGKPIVVLFRCLNRPLYFQVNRVLSAQGSVTVIRR